METFTFRQETNPLYVLTEVLSSVESRIAEIKAKLAQLTDEAKSMQWDSFEYRSNYLMQQHARGQLQGLAYAQGSLEGRIGVTKIWLE